MALVWLLRWTLPVLLRAFFQSARVLFTDQILSPGLTPDRLATAIDTTSPLEYRIALRPLSKMMGTSLVDLEAFENGEQVLAQTFDHLGKPVSDPAQAKHSTTIHIFAMICAIACATVMVNLSRTWEALPGGFVGGAIGGGIGGFFGGLIGAGAAWMFRKR